MEQRRFLQQDPATRKYSVGPKIFELGTVYLSHVEINAKASRPLHRLASRTGLNGRVGIWESGAALITLLALPRSEDSLSHQIGPRVPAYCSGIGKALLAHLEAKELEEYLRRVSLVRHTQTTITSRDKLREDLDKTRERGYSIGRAEMIPGVAALGAPIFDRRHQLAGAISISQSPEVVLGRRMKKLAAELLETAFQISREMGCYLSAGGPERGKR